MRTGVFHGGHTSYLPPWATILSILFFITIMAKAAFLHAELFNIQYVNEYIMKNLDTKSWNSEVRPDAA